MKEGVRWSPMVGSTQMIPRAFIQQGLTHYQTGEYMDIRQAWRRAERGGVMVPRYPLKLMRGPSLAKVFSDDSGFQSSVEKTGSQIIEKKLDQQVQRVLAKLPK